jgi:hypothetical protein
LINNHCLYDVLFSWKKPETMFLGGKGAFAPQFWQRLFSTDRKTGHGFLAPPNIWSATETYRQFATERLKT